MILIIGRPNAGKTTYSAKFDKVIHLDDFPWKNDRFHNCNLAVAEADEDTVTEGIYTTRKRREEWLAVAKGRKVCIWLDTPLEECIARNSRGRSIFSMRHVEPPTYDEGWDEIIVIRGNENGDVD